MDLSAITLQISSLNRRSQVRTDVTSFLMNPVLKTAGTAIPPSE